MLRPLTQLRTFNIAIASYGHWCFYQHYLYSSSCIQHEKILFLYFESLVFVLVSVHDSVKRHLPDDRKNLRFSFKQQWICESITSHWYIRCHVLSTGQCWHLNRSAAADQCCLIVRTCPGCYNGDVLFSPVFPAFMFGFHSMLHLPPTFERQAAELKAQDCCK